ncbi:LOW QUALITY PROTEIN: gamma-tubulin complex component 6 [Tamandua tetradactyla]|uniref:LOW QUALITY PROTEIN: gamma-tubulin complex component 6 n=1 Tax=Tamandua tetradactyla TaxID=48850 RepID=UPI00405489B4
MASITQLFEDLCEAHLPPVKAHLGQRSMNRKEAKQSLKRVAYNALFTNLFQDEHRKPQPDLSKLPVKNKILMQSFDLRVAGLGPEADRLEELVEKLETATCCPLVEVGSVLDLVVHLAGSGPPQVLPRKRNYCLNNKHVRRNIPYTGYDCYNLHVFEMDVQSFISREEYLCNDMIQKTLQVMEAAPGTGLPSIGLFSYGDCCGDKFERDTRVSLFGALVHSHTDDMDVRLDLPPVPDSADLSGLAIKVEYLLPAFSSGSVVDLPLIRVQVPQSTDQSEDEGFQSASNLTPDSQSEPSMTPDLDLWDAVLTYEASKRRCWERVGCPPGHREEPYLTEAGRDAFDRFCRLHEGDLQVLSGGLLQVPPLILVEEGELVKDALNVLIGVVSATFPLCQPSQAFVVKPGIFVSGVSPESVSSLLSEVATYGTCYSRLSRFSLQPALGSSHSRGLVFQAFSSGLRQYLQYYRACVLSTPPTLSLLTIGFLFKKLGRQLRYLAELCGVGTMLPGTNGGTRAAFPTGVKLLSYLYQEALDNCSNEHYPVLLSLLKTSCEPYTRFIHDWVYSGVFRDVHGEFMIQVNHEYLSYRDKLYWTHGYVLISKEVEDCVPVFLKHIANDVYICGKTLNLLKLCCPQHYLCWSDIPVPRISVIFSLEELKEIEKDCAVYVGRMERAARLSCLSKEEKELHVEIAKQELIIHAREAASRALSTLSDQQMSERMAADARKREQFRRLKDQFMRDQERRLAARQEEIDDDFSYARELRERERRLAALEAELERQARQALVDHYSKLSAEAARREQKALWKAQRHRLGSARLRFLSEDWKRIREMLQDAPEVKGHQPPDTSPGTPAESQPGAGVSCAQPTALGPRHLAAFNSLSRPRPQLPETLTAGPSGPWPAADPQPGWVEQIESFSTGLSVRDFLPIVVWAGQPAGRGEAPHLEEALHTISADLPPSTPGTQHEYDFSTVLRPAVTISTSPGSFQALESGLGREGQQVQGDTQLDMVTCDPDARVSLSHPHSLGHSFSEEGGSQSQGQLLEHVSDSRPTAYCAERAPSRRRWNVHGHVSDSSIGVGENVSAVAPSRPRWNVHGHVSDSSIGVGENVSAVAPSRPRWNVHGHVSDSSIGVGENVSAKAPSRPRWNVHGHVSDSSIGVGENVSAEAPSRPRWNIHGHVSDSSIGVGRNMSAVASSRPRWNACGYFSQSCMMLGTHSGEAEPEMSRPHQSLPGPVAPSDLSLGTQTSPPGDELQPEAEMAPGSPACAVVQVACCSTGLESGLQAPPSAAAEGGALGDGGPAKQGPGSGHSQDSSPSQPSSPQEGEAAEAVAWCPGSEQAYLKELAAQYHAERYPDSYETLTAETPVAHLLHHVLPRPFSLPVDPQVEAATGEAAVQLSELLTLPVLMQQSISAPLAAHVSLVNKAVVDYFFVELRLETHFEALRHFLLMEDGEFAQSLSDLLFEKLGAGQTPGELLNPLVLNSILAKALQYSLHGDSPLAAGLSFALKHLPETFAPNAPDVLSCLELRYKVDWPLNIVITERCLSKYSGIFSFLLQLKLMMWTLKDVCFQLKRTALLSRTSSSVQFRQLQLFKHEMQHFVKVIQGYIATQILHVSWCEFRNKLAAVGDLEELHRAHAEYLSKAVFRGLLTEKAAPVMNVIHSVFSLILKFRSQLISQAWGPATGPHGAEHPNFALMQQSYNTFKYYSHFLFKVVTKLVNRGYQPHLEDFLLRINFNSYYQDA